MTTITECPGSNAGALRFKLFGVPVTVKFWFWVSVLLMGMGQETGAALIWVAVCFVSILWHELGHVVAFRAFGERSEVVLYAWGGLTVPAYSRYRGNVAEIAISLAGPVAGFCLAAVVLGIAALAGAQIQMGTFLLLPIVRATFPPPEAFTYGYFYKSVLVSFLLYVNIFWGFLNLLPIWPFDGGHIARGLFEGADPARGRRKSLLLSAVVAGLIALVGVLWMRSIYVALVFGLLAISSAQTMESMRRPERPPERWR